jgi:hypothetical protein
MTAPCKRPNPSSSGECPNSNGYSRSGPLSGVGFLGVVLIDGSTWLVTLTIGTW